MTKKEITGKRSLDFSKWSRKKLLCSEKGLTWIDVDYYGRRYDTHPPRFILCEMKTNRASLQKRLDDAGRYGSNNRFYINHAVPLHNALIQYEKIKPKLFSYYGIHLVQFSKTSPSNSKIWFDLEEVSEGELIELLNMDKKPKYKTFYESRMKLYE